MPATEYKAFEALDPFFEIVMQGLSGLVDGKHYFDSFAEVEGEPIFWRASPATARQSGFTIDATPAETRIA